LKERGRSRLRPFLFSIEEGWGHSRQFKKRIFELPRASARGFEIFPPKRAFKPEN